MYKEKDSLAFLLLFFILLPYLMTVIILGREACPLSREISLEEYVPAVTASQISWDCSKETIKVQTVAARSNLYLLQDTDKEESVIQEAVNYISQGNPGTGAETKWGSKGNSLSHFKRREDKRRKRDPGREI